MDWLQLDTIQCSGTDARYFFSFYLIILFCNNVKLRSGCCCCRHKKYLRQLGLESRSGRIFGTQPQPNSHLGKNKAIKKIPTDLDLSR